MTKFTTSKERVKLMCHGCLVDGHLKDNFFLTAIDYGLY